MKKICFTGKETIEVNDKIYKKDFLEWIAKEKPKWYRLLIDSVTGNYYVEWKE